jgi:hypothetical protein
VVCHDPLRITIADWPHWARLPAQYETDIHLLCVDPLIDGVAPIVERLCSEFPA